MVYSFQRLKYLLLLLLSALGLSAVTSAASASAATTTPLAYSKPDRLVPSTGNLYWTSDSHGLVAYPGLSRQSTSLVGIPIPYTGYVWRASKSNLPGHEVQLYSETENYPVDFEAITWALVGGQYYGYFVANYPSLGISQIKRVPLAGGAAVTLATSRAQIGARDLVNDGSYLYWADAAGIRKMAIGGGPVTTLVSGTTFTHLGLDSSLVYYTSGQDVMSIAKTGGSPTVFGAGASTITALDVAPPDASIRQPVTVVYVGEANGSVIAYDQNDPPFTVKAPSSGVSISSVSFTPVFSDPNAASNPGVVANGYALLWGYCNSAGCGVAGYARGYNSGLHPVYQQLGVWEATSAAPIDPSIDGGGAYWADRYLEKGSL